MDHLHDTSPNELQLYGHSNLQAMLPVSTSTPPSDGQILYIPVVSPPTPAASPRPASNDLFHRAGPPLPLLSSARPSVRREYLSSIVSSCTPDELRFLSKAIAPLLKFQFSLPEELLLHVLSFVDDLHTLLNAMRVSKQWHRVSRDESIWQARCIANNFDGWEEAEIRWRRKQQRHFQRNAMKQSSVQQSSSSDSYRSQPYNSSADFPASSSSEIDAYRPFSFRRYFRETCMIHTNWRRGGRLLNSDRLPIIAPDSGTVTSVALDRKWLVVGLASSMIKVYDARTGMLVRTLKGHDSGVWGVCLVSGGDRDVPPPRPSKQTYQTSHKHRDRGVDDLGSRFAGLKVDSTRDGLHVMPDESLPHLVPPAMQYALGLDPGMFGDSDEESETSSEGGADRDPADHASAKHQSSRWTDDHDGRQGEETWQHSTPSENDNASNPCYASKGWGQPNPIIVSGGCDKVIRVWDLKSGQCIYVLHGHTSTIRSLRVLNTRPIAVTGSRDATLRVWDVQMGRCLRVLEGHASSVRCLDVHGDKVVSGSYDATCRIWNIDTGECLHVLTGHFSQIYSVAFDGVRIASGGLDTSVRIWDAETGQCTALLQGHTALVCQLQLATGLLATGGADGRVITFSLDTYAALHRIAAHDSSVTALQFDGRFLVTGGNDGRVRVYETATGAFVRELTDASESVWKVAFTRDTCVVMCKRARKTVVEIWSMHPRQARSSSAGKAKRELEGAQAAAGV